LTKLITEVCIATVVIQ